MDAPRQDPPSEPYVLVVEDDALTQSVIVQVLAEEGCPVLATPSGHEALELVQARLPSVVVLDYLLQDMDGAEFIRRYRQAPIPHAPVVLVTAEYQPEHVAGAIGAAAVLSKPFDLDQLVDVLRPFVPRLSQP